MKRTTAPAFPPDKDGDGRWMSQHNRQLAESKEREPEVVFIGDTIIQDLQQRPIWNDLFEPLHSLNLGIGHDKTQNVLWRIEKGILDYVNPKIVVLHVGTYNTDDTPEDVADGIVEIVEEIQKKLPNALVIVMELLPRGQAPNSLREQNEEVNHLLHHLLDNMERVELVPVCDNLIQADGTICHHDMLDYLRPTEAGYRKIFEPIYSIILENLFRIHDDDDDDDDEGEEEEDEEEEEEEEEDVVA